MSNLSSCFPSNPDISGIGVRTAIYAQNLLSFIPAIFALLDWEVTPAELERLENQSMNILITAFAVLLSAIVQVFNKGLTNLHATIILNLSWMNNTNLFIYFLLYVYHRLRLLEKERQDDFKSWLLEKNQQNDQENSFEFYSRTRTHNGSGNISLWIDETKKALHNPVLIIGSVHLTFMAAVGIWLWHKPLGFADSPEPYCSQSASVVILGQQVSLASNRLQVWSIFIYSILLTPVLNLIIPAVFLTAPLFLYHHLTLNLFKIAHQQLLLKPIVGGLAALAVINIIFLGDTEASIQKNSHLVQEGDTAWTFGQTLALLLLLVPLRDLVETLLERLPKRLGKTLQQASAKGDFAVAQYVLQLGADPNVKDSNGYTSLIHAASMGCQGLVDALLQRHADVNATAMQGDTALILAVQNGHQDIVNALLKHHAYVNAKTMHGDTALILAVQNGHQDIVNALLKHGADMNATVMGGDTALILAVQNGHQDVVNALLDHHANVDARAMGGYTALILAVQNGHQDIVNALLKHHAYVNAKTMHGDTALILAVQNGHQDIVNALLKHHAYVNAKTMHGDTALILAVQNGHQDIVDALLKHGADVNARTMGGDTALILAVQNEHHNVVHTLLKHGADVNATGHHGHTALLCAVGNGYQDVVHALLKHHADVNIYENYGKTPQSIAADHGDLEIVRMLENYSAPALD